MLDVEDFERFVETVEPLLKPARDVMWVLTGRIESNVPKVKKILTKHKLSVEVFYMCYNTKQMQHYGYWKRQRGIANSKSLEQAFCVYKGKLPKNMPKNRMYVDVGSSLFNQVMKNVPVLAPKNHAYVSRAVRDTSLGSMVGIPHNEDDGEQERLKLILEDDDDAPRLDQPEEVNQQAAIAIHVKKRRLYRVLSGTDVPWFPHDNDMELLKELCWEAGRPRWVFYGTPAGGAGIHGCLEAGCSVVALCYDEHHRAHLGKFLLERAVEAMVAGTTVVFKDEGLQARSVELNLKTAASAPKTPKPEAKKEESSQEEEARPKKESKKPKKESKKKAKPKKKVPKKKESSSSKKKESSSSSENSDASSKSDSGTEPPAKKSTKT